jgi:hypothetical protein
MASAITPEIRSDNLLEHEEAEGRLLMWGTILAGETAAAVLQGVSLALGESRIPTTFKEVALVLTLGTAAVAAGKTSQAYRELEELQVL